MSIFKRIFGICSTKPPADEGCWIFEGGKIELDLSRIPELIQKGSAIRLEKKGLGYRILLVHGDDGEFHAFHNKCTHAGRRIDPLPGTSTLRCCSVGKSTWDYQGKLISGSAKEPLTGLPVEKAEGKVTIRLA